MRRQRMAARSESRSQKVRSLIRTELAAVAYLVYLDPDGGCPLDHLMDGGLTRNGESTQWVFVFRLRFAMPHEIESSRMIYR